MQSFESLEVRAETLLTAHAAVKKELDATKASMEELKARLELREHDLEILKEENRVLKMAGAFKGAGENTDVADTKRRINAMVREIDKCIALMND